MNYFKEIKEIRNFIDECKKMNEQLSFDFGDENIENEYIKSPFNYVGNKSKLLFQLKKYFPKKYNRFIDLFCGSCVVGINSGSNEILFNDKISPLIKFYQILKEKDINEIVQEIDNIILKYNLPSEEGYNKLREDYNNTFSPLFLFVLTNYSYNKNMRFKKDLLHFNSSFGKNRTIYNDDIKNRLISFTNHLKKINSKFFSFDFKDLNNNIDIQKGDFVYCDPPYAITDAQYNRHWKNDDSSKLLELLNDINNKGAYFMLSEVLENKNKTNDALLKWARNYKIIHLNRDYNNSSPNTKKENRIYKTDEVIIINY